MILVLFFSFFFFSFAFFLPSSLTSLVAAVTFAEEKSLLMP